jgi:tetratricopeptide (TPR) repeat protein
MMDGDEKTGLSGLKVMFFDEVPKKRKYYLSMLRMCGLREILIADNVPDAARIVMSSSIDLIVLTHSDSGAGMEFLQELRSLDATASIPVVAIMSEFNVMNGLRLLAQGINHVLTDPLSQLSVEAMVQKLFRERFGTDHIDREIEIARRLLDEGKLDDARRLYERCLRMDGILNDQLFEIYLGLAHLATESNAWLEAESNLFHALEIAKSESNRVETHWLLSRAFYRYGRLYEKRGMAEKALKSYQTAMSFNPYQVTSLKPLLVFLLKQDNFSEIERLLSEARTNFPPYSKPLGELAEALDGMAVRSQVLGMPIFAARLYEKLITIPHDRAVVHFNVSDHFLNNGKISLVLTTLKEVSTRVRSPEIFFKIGSILLDVEKRYLVDGQLKRSSDVDLSFFKSLDSPKTLQLAHRAFQEGLLLDPGHIQLRLGVAYCLMRKGEYQALSDLLDKFKEGTRQSRKLFIRVIEMLIEGRLYDLAQTWIQDAVSRFPREAVFYECAARCCKAQKKPKQALDHLKKALSLSPEHPGLALSLARLYEELGQSDEAGLYFQKAKTLSTDGVPNPKAPEVVAAGRKDPGKRSRKWFG